MFFFDPVYFIFALPALLLAGLASMMTKSTFNKYSQVASMSGKTGAEAAATMLRNAGITDVRIERISGFLSDHYDPTQKVLRLSPDVYDSRSLSAIGVACHEAGHAIQHAEGYVWLGMRSALVPAVNFASNFSYIFLMVGFLLSGLSRSFGSSMVLLGILLFSLSVIFSIVTLPVEWDASARAKKLMVVTGAVSEREAQSAGEVLNAAFMTYVASAVSALMTLLYYLFRAGLLGGSDE